MNNLWGMLASLAFVSLTVGAGTLLHGSGRLDTEGSRKFMHMLMSHWWLIAAAFFTSVWWAAATPAAFVVFSALSDRFKLLKAMERNERGRGLGTVWYAVSLLLLVLWTFPSGTQYVGTIAVLSMGYGDAMAAVAGRRWGRHGYPPPGGGKTLEGSAALVPAVFAVSFAVLSAVRPEGALRHALVLAASAALLEAVTPLGLDNLTVPLGLALLAAWMAHPAYPADLMLGLALSLLVVLPAWALQSLTFPACLAAAAVGALLFWAGRWVFFCALGAFFLSSAFAGRLGRARKDAAARRMHRRHGARGIVQVLANGAPALACAVLFRLTGFEPLAVGCLAALAAAGADTWSSEIGMLSPRAPRSILTGRELPRGLSGGVTALGFAGAAVGAAAVAAVALFHGNDGFPNAAAAAVVFACGLAGAAADSALGDAAQAKYRHPVSGEMTERPGADGMRAPLARGLRWVDNDAVNFISCIAAGALGCAARILLG